MNPIKPEYFFRLRYLWRRLLALVFSESNDLKTVSCFGMKMIIDPSETIGASLWRFGIYDLAQSEVIWRLLDPGECAWDIGANIGCVTALMIQRVGPLGHVVSVEPHPQLNSQLLKQLAEWRSRVMSFPDVRTYSLAVASGGGVENLVVPQAFTKNSGLSRLGHPESGETTIEVGCIELDQIQRDTGHRCHLIKMDIEGGELSAFQSGAKLIGERQVRDIVFEDLGRVPSKVTEYLEKAGYQIFRIEKRFFKPALVPFRNRSRASRWEPTNYLATLDAARAQGRMQALGWKVLA